MIDPAPNDRVLIVDDTLESLQFLTDTLERAGLDVHVAISGEAALDVLGKIKPSVILMDAVMPGIDGFETTRRIKQQPDIADIPVIFMTGLTAPEHAVDALEAGGVDYVRKPIVVEELLARVKVHLANAKQSRSSLSALDAVGRHVFAVDPSAALLWSTPEADKLLQAYDPCWSPTDGRAPLGLQKFIQDDPDEGASKKIDRDDFALEALVVSRKAPGEIIFRLKDVREGADAERLALHFGLTRREAEVLQWVSYGKPNRVISENLGASPRTINKHLEHIFEKLGVETRAAAAACAVRALSE